jgi:hypothetical protein
MLASKDYSEHRRDVLSDWARPRDQATIRRRHATALSDEEIIEREIKQRLALDKLPAWPVRLQS